jgi:hypothetical protein
VSDIFLPVSLDVARIRLRKLEYVGVSRNPYNGTVRRALRGGDKFGGTIELTPQGGSSSTSRSKRRRMIATLMQAGKYNTLLFCDPSYTPAGSFPSTELLTNGDFNSTAGWSGSSVSQSVADNVMRSLRTTSGVVNLLYNSPSVTGIQYAPYIVRAMVARSVSASQLGIGVGSTTTDLLYGYSNAMSDGLLTKAIVPYGTSLFATIFDEQPTGIEAGEFYSTSFVSLTRCALADAGPNSALQSDTFNTTWAASQGSVSANAVAAPDGTTTADAFVENGAAGIEHSLSQSVTVSSSVLDYNASVYLKDGANGHSWARLAMYESGLGHLAYAFINLSTGALGTVSVSGANWTNARAHVVNYGNGWYRLFITARKVSSGVGISTYINSATADLTVSFTGNSLTAFYAWRAVFAQSSGPTRGAQTTSAALASGTAQTGSSIYAKGLPVSTAGLLEIGDAVEIYTSLGSQYGVLTARLNSDAAGLGSLQVWPAIRGSVADNAVIIVNKPMLRVIMPEGVPEYLTEPGLITTGGAIDFEESAS